MKSSWFWHARAQEQYERIQKHTAVYHGSILDIPEYCKLFFFGFMSWIAPKRRDILKYEGDYAPILDYERKEMIDKWEEMTPDERDWLVHEVVMLERRWTHEPVVCPYYTRSLDAAWEVVEKMNQPTALYARFIMALEAIVGSNLFYDLFRCDDGNRLTPERICMAALRAKGM